MNLTPKALLFSARDTLADPAAAARRVMALNLSEAEAFMALGITAAAATLLTAVMQVMLGAVADSAMQALFDRPFLLAFSQFILMAVGAFLMWRVGKVFGGTGTFAQALSLVAWLEVVLILLQLAEMIVILVLPILAAPVGLASLFAFFYLITHFTAALNGFTSLTKTFFAILATAFAVLLLVSFVLVFFIQVPHV
ncbi:MAG: YIP1 family protein [Cypionkella sp.]